MLGFLFDTKRHTIMTLEEIRKERKKLIEAEDFDIHTWEKMDELRLKEERLLKRIHFHFEENISVSQIQLFAKVFKCFINGPYVLECRHLSQLVLPNECKNVDELKNYAGKASFVGLFFVSTPIYEALEYTTAFNKQIPDMRVSLDLQSAQEDYQKIRDFSNIEESYDLIDRMITSYMLSNSSIGHNLFFENYSLGGYRFQGKLAPNISYRDVLLRLRSTISIASDSTEDKNMATYAKYQILDFAYQCRYLSFWSCLIDVMSFPGLSQEESEVLNNVAGWFLGNLTNPYVYHISCESSFLNKQKPIADRESCDNTTRFKIYLTKADDEPLLVRFDLPHKGESYVHLNIQQGGKNVHYRLSDDVEDNRFDHVFDNLCESLTAFNFNGSFLYHSPESQDSRIIKRMLEYTAMMNLATYMVGLSFGVSFDELPPRICCSLLYSIQTLRGVVNTEIGGSDELSLPEVYMYADMILEKELKSI